MKLTSMNIRAICAVLLIVSFFLPVARGCSKIQFPQQVENGTGDNGEKAKSWIDLEVKDPQVVYAYEAMLADNLTTADSFLLMFFGYFWPIPMLLFHILTRKKWKKYILTVAELILCLITSQLIIILAVFSGKLLIGWYLGMAAASVYFCVTAYGLTKDIILYFRDRKARTSIRA